MIDERCQLDLPLFGGALPLPATASLIVVAASSGDAGHIREHLLAASRGERGAFLIREADGALPVGPECVVALHEDGRLHLFAPPSLASPALPRLLMHAFSRGDAGSNVSAFDDLLLVRLWGNGAPTNDGSQADRPLGRGLAHLQTSDMHVNPFIFRTISERLLDQLGEGAATGLRAMLRRAWAASVLTATRSAPATREAAFAAAWHGLELAAREFEQAGLYSLAERCANEADGIGMIVRAADGTEPYIPGLPQPDQRNVKPPRIAFRSFRCIGIRVPLPGAQVLERENATPHRPLGLVEAGSLGMRDLRLGAILGSASYPGLVPRVRALPAKAAGGGRRIRVWLDEEHKALLDLPVGKAATLGDRRYIVSVWARGRIIEPPFRAARQGQPTDFYADTNKLPDKVTVRVSGMDQVESFRVAVG